MVAAGKFLGVKGSQMNVTGYAYAKAGLRPALLEDEGYLATDRVMKAIGVDVDVSLHTAMDPEKQFWQEVNGAFELTEAGMK